MHNIKHLLDETESNIRFALPEQVMLGEANRTITHGLSNEQLKHREACIVQ